MLRGWVWLCECVLVGDVSRGRQCEDWRHAVIVPAEFCRGPLFMEKGALPEVPCLMLS